MSRDPNHGPLSARQFSVLTEALLRQQPATLGQAATAVCKELGPNTRNIALLRVRDFHVFHDPSDLAKKSYQIDIPRIKKRFTRVRKTKRRPLSQPAGEVLETLIAENRRRFCGEDPDWPIFCRESPLQRPRNRFPWQCTTLDIYNAVVRYGEESKLTSNGSDDGNFRINPRRLRYTYGTRLAAEGATVRQIAEALDHSDKGTAMVYINASLSMVERLFEHVDPRIAPLMDEFMGRMRGKTGSDTLIPGRSYRGVLLGGIGICGSGTLCKLMPGFSCYVCNFMYPIADAPHREMLEEAYAIRRSYKKVADATTENAQVEFLDTVIMAIEAAIGASEKWIQMNQKGDGWRR